MGYEFESVKSERAYVDAESMGCYVKVPADNELFIDIDGPSSQGEKMMDWFAFNFSKIEEHIGGVITSDTPSQSGTPGRKHIVVSCNRKLEPMERILLQAVLGSDLQREALSWVRLVNNDSKPTLFFEKKPLALPSADHLQLEAKGI